ncbi:low molecular weight phosphatase family protein [Epilithonimonas hungarica]|uniref:Protein-tyrosine phosphatase/arsenate reductase n=1 Tax=Epilithonimonas hungarica TaxID=454006 RepID=A0A1G7IKX3_9FLAO|nr:protein-tyrosine-phosphatase [Epilithonimonas hungarica]MDP9958074.1 protein-tyrosine phosphatase/arsenate reductase [Epilithonimonas hungarica]SDF13265.1 protein-tyrosine phosphatase/arsenate reductase [Epilithonimonas hungarica]
MFQKIKERCEILSKNFKEINPERKALLEKLASHIQVKINGNIGINLIYVCTHNSRRSHLGQVWSKVAADFYGFNINTFSAGTEATAFNQNAIHALISAGFEIKKSDGTDNPRYEVFFGDGKSNLCFSKTIDDESLPKENFAAVMTCGDADENCPFIPGCDLRIGTTYFDPKSYDNSVLQNEKYTERSNQIAMECLYVFSLLKK